MPERDTLLPSRRSRRGFLKAAAVGSAAAALPALPVSAQEPAGRRLGAGVSAYGGRSRFEVATRRVRGGRYDQAAGSLTPLQHLDGAITPSALHFERHHAGIPDIDPAEHRLAIGGLVERPLVFTMAELRRLPAVNRVYFIECSGNGRVKWSPAQPDTDAQAAFGMTSCSEWTGVPLSVLLREAGVRPEARWLVAEGADACRMTRSVPLDKAMDDVLVAWGQNGEALRPAQGYPLRLLIPGWEGNISIKWLRRMQLVDRAWQTREETSKYTDLMPNGEARQFTFVMDAKSVITRPSGGAAARRAGLPPDLGARVVGPRPGAGGRGLDRRRRLVGGGAAPGAGAAPGPHPVPPRLALGRFAGDPRLPLHRRDRRPAADARRADSRRGARARATTTTRCRPGASGPTAGWRTSMCERAGGSAPMVGRGASMSERAGAFGLAPGPRTSMGERVGASVRTAGWRRTMSERLVRAALAAMALPMVCAGAVWAQTSDGGRLTNLGTPATPEEIAAWGPIVGPDGEGLPAGGGTAAEGRALYDRRCAACHGPTGQEGPDDRLAGGQGSLAGDRARKTVGSYWPAATTLWDYVNRAMPFNPARLALDRRGLRGGRLRALPQRPRRRGRPYRPGHPAAGRDAQPRRLCARRAPRRGRGVRRRPALAGRCAGPGRRWT